MLYNKFDVFETTTYNVIMIWNNFAGEITISSSIFKTCELV